MGAVFAKGGRARREGKKKKMKPRNSLVCQSKPLGLTKLQDVSLETRKEEKNQNTTMGWWNSFVWFELLITAVSV
jgi:hypothetical protein